LTKVDDELSETYADHLVSMVMKGLRPHGLDREKEL
jgi:hypothetical protein